MISALGKPYFYNKKNAAKGQRFSTNKLNLIN